jgi:hypothetical protein
MNWSPGKNKINEDVRPAIAGIGVGQIGGEDRGKGIGQSQTQ